MDLHGAVINPQKDDQQHHNQGQQRIEVIRDGLYKNADTVFPFYKAGNRRGPGRNRRNDADRRRRGVDQVGQLGAADVIFVGYRTHNGTHGQAVEIVINENQAAQQHGCQLRTGTAFDMRGRPLTERGGTAGTVHQLHHHAQNNQENQNAYVPLIR